MSLLSDHIEEFIKSMMDEEEAMIELQRNELAQHFRCAPSQINYVLATRFTVDQGYMIESRRGGGGYIRIIRMAVDRNGYMLHLLTERIGRAISEKEACDIAAYLQEEEMITPKEYALMRAALSDKALPLPSNTLRDDVRAALFKNMLLAYMVK